MHTEALRWIGVAAGAVVILGGCESESPVPESPPSDYFEVIIGRAEAQGASDAQLAALRDGADQGGVTYAQVDALMGDFFACLKDSGLAPERLPDKPIAPGVSAPDYAVGFKTYTPEQGDALTQECLTKTMDFAMEALYQQPSSVEAMDRDIFAHLPEIADCTSAHGYPLEDDANLDEIRVALQGAMADANVECYTYSG